MVSFIDQHKEEYGVEPMCSVLPIAPSTYHEHARRKREPERRPARHKRDDALFKTEVIYRRGPWRSREAVELATLEWVDWFNNRRLLQPLGYIPPAEFETAYYDKQPDLAMVVGFK